MSQGPLERMTVSATVFDVSTAQNRTPFPGRYTSINMLIARYAERILSTRDEGDT